MKNFNFKQSLAQDNSEKAKLWHPTKNGDLTPDNVGRYSRKKVWWLCKNGHEWQAAVGKTWGKCPVCKLQRVPKEKSLALLDPKLASEWHPHKNGNITPLDVSRAATRIVWWQCKNRHEWQAKINNRRNRGCPYCSGRKPLSSAYPALAKLWHPTKNKGLTPDDVGRYSRKKVWWLCKNGHQWRAAVNKTWGICPVCKISIKKKNPRKSRAKYFAAAKPDILKLWHPTKNQGLNSKKIKRGSGRKIWLQCKNGHDWQAVVNKTAGLCPVCKIRCLPVEKSLAGSDPELAKEWHPTKNDNITPFDVSPWSIRVVWWQCNKGHQWQARIANRSRGRGCHYCTGYKSDKSNC